MPRKTPAELGKEIYEQIDILSILLTASLRLTRYFPSLSAVTLSVRLYHRQKPVTMSYMTIEIFIFVIFYNEHRDKEDYYVEEYH